MIYLLIIAAIVALDQITKYIVLTTVTMSGPRIVVIENFFYITCHRNSGAAWGLFQGGRYFFLVFTAVLLVGLAVMMFRFKGRWFRTALAVIIGGAIGNFIDRIMVGGVVDFLDFYIFGYNFPTFNAADSCIVVGSVLLIIYFMRSDNEIFKTEKADRSAAEMDLADAAAAETAAAEVAEVAADVNVTDADADSDEEDTDAADTDSDSEEERMDEV